VDKDLLLKAEHCEHFMRNRRSIRVYKNKPIPRGDLQRVIEIARYAPSGHNSQCAEWLVLENRDTIHNLAGIVAEWMRWMIGNLPDIAASMHMDKVLKRWDEGEDVFLRGAPVVIIAHAEKENPLAYATCTIALTYLELAAPSLGLGCCWAGYFNRSANTFPPMQQALVLPEGHQSYGAMMVGYPKFNYHRLPSRKPPPITWRD
jgi:nitroreductase